MGFKDIVWDMFFKHNDEFVANKLLYDEELVKYRLKNKLLNNELIQLKKKYEPFMKETTLERFWNNKRPKTHWLHRARPDPLHPNQRISVDPRIFFQNDYTLPIIKGKDYDDIANKTLKYIIRNYKYIPDKKEYWQFAYETLHRGGGDCVAEYEEIITWTGIKTAKDLKEGDRVLSYDFNAKRFVFKPIVKKWDKGVKIIRRVYFNTGETIDITSEHNMLVKNREYVDSFEKKRLCDIDFTNNLSKTVPIATRINISTITPVFPKEYMAIIGIIIRRYKEKSRFLFKTPFIDKLKAVFDKYDVKYSVYKANDEVVPLVRILDKNFKLFVNSILLGSHGTILPYTVFLFPSAYIKEFFKGFSGREDITKPWKTFVRNKDIADMLVLLGKRIGLRITTKLVNKKTERLMVMSDYTFAEPERLSGYEPIGKVKIVKVEELGKVQTYDWEVKDTHNFVFKNGIITHNCEDGAILMANIMLASGVPYWRIRLNAGEVKGGGHAYVTYLREADNKWYILDWSYYPSESINFRKSWKDAEKYFGIWGSWNSKYMFGEKPFNGRDSDENTE